MCIYTTQIHTCVYVYVYGICICMYVCVVVIIIIIKYKHILQSQDRFNLQVQNTHYQQFPLKNKSEDPYISTKKGKIVIMFINISIRDPICNKIELFPCLLVYGLQNFELNGQPMAITTRHIVHPTHSFHGKLSNFIS